ncbi:MAG: sigma-70 family RNA polymerase sigma factor [Clostridiales bacterium]|nr:sigma-70 family RNA polymerase sigma factor [Clostridiales bacterium]
MVNNNEYMNIVNQYKKPLFKYCFYRLMNNTALAQETVDDIFCVLYTKWDTLDVNKNIKAYLYRVADNCIKHNLTRFNRYYKHNESLEEAIENHKLDTAYHMDDYFNDLHFDEEIYIEKIKQCLPTHYQEIFVYRYVEKKTLTEIAQIVGMPYSTLRLRITKIDMIIRDIIKNIFN